MKLRYTGQQDSNLVIIDRSTGTTYQVEKGNVEVPNELGKMLVGQSIWSEVTAKKEGKK